MALSTGIPVREWENEDEQTIITAWHLLEEMNDTKGGGNG